MKFKFIIAILFLCLLIIPLRLQGEKLSQPITILYMPQGFVAQDLSGKGFLGSTESIISNINAGNPASITDFNNLQVGSSFQLETKIKNAWLANIGHGRKNNFPQSIGIAYSLKNFHFGVASNQLYNTEIDYGKIKGTMVWDNELGYIDTEVFKPYRDEVIFKNSVISAYKLNSILIDKSSLAIGFQFNSNYYAHFQTLGKSYVPLENGEFQIKKNEFRDYDIENNFSIGVRYSIENNLLSAKLGVFYDSQIIYEDYWVNENEKFSYSSTIPQKLNYGFSLKYKDRVNLINNISYHYFEEIDGYNKIENLLEWSASLAYSYTENLLFSIATKKTDRNYLYEGHYFYDKDQFFCQYISLGCVYNFKNYEIDCVVADSYLLSDDRRKHTIFKVGLGYSFGK